MTQGIHDAEDDSSVYSESFDKNDSTTCEDKFSETEERDEVKEILKLTQKETRRVQIWRCAATGMLLLTAFAVTFTTYRFLKDEEKNNFETAVRYLNGEFCRTVNDDSFTILT